MIGTFANLHYLIRWDEWKTSVNILTLDLTLIKKMKITLEYGTPKLKTKSLESFVFTKILF